MKTKSIALAAVALTFIAAAIIAAALSGSRTGAYSQTVNQASQTQQFINVDGADLKSKIDAATKMARSRTGQSMFWVAYSFDVRPGIAVDPGIGSFNGSMTTHGDTTIFFGTAGGITVETRNLGVFALIQPSDNSVARVEVYNLERKREYSGYPVYWMGRAGNQESLDYLKSLAGSSARRVAENSVMAIGMHDASEVPAILKDLTRRSSIVDVREAAIFWLGFTGGEQAFLADIVRNEQENADVREAAASAIGRSHDAGSLALLQNLYGQVTNRDVKEQLLHAIGRNDDQKAAITFLGKIAKTDSDRELREAAVHSLGRLPGTQSFLADVVRDEKEISDVREAAVHAIGKSSDQQSMSTLQGLYKSVANTDVREAILNAVSKNADQQAALDFLVSVAKSDPSRDLKEQAVNRLGKLPGTGALLLEIARNESESSDVREAAVNAIGRSSDAGTLSTLQSLYESTTNRDVKEQVLNSISKNQDQEAALNFLIKTAESDPDHDLREQAVTRLSRSSSARAFETLKRIAVSSGDSDLEEQAVNAISKRPADESVPALIDIAKTHPRADVREAAVRRLSRMNDERAKQYIKQLLSNQ